MATSIGVDLSLVGTGIVVIQDGKIIEQELIKSKPVGPKPKDELIRIRKIVEEIKAIIDIYRSGIGIAVIENLAFMARNTTALTQLAGLNYFTRAMLYDYGIPFYLCAPTTLKRFATSRGNCPKDNVMMEIYKRWHVTITNNNIADAFILSKIGQAILEGDMKLTIPQQESVDLIKKQL